ncbi:MAG: nicotinate-nucleotide--dimethylbenzimidazole phosphoribosyltransferase [bacterium]
MKKILNIITQIKPLDKKIMQMAKKHNENLAIPKWSLGKLQKLSIKIAGIQKKNPLKSKNKVIAIMAGDHGVVQENISLFPQEVTTQMVYNFLKGNASINVLAQHSKIKIIVVDMGIAKKIKQNIKSPYQFIDKKIGNGTFNISKRSAMSKKQAIDSIQTGIEIFEKYYSSGIDIIGTGDMGIGNTTSSAAIACVIINQSPKVIVGRGTGLSNLGLENKIKVVEKSIKINNPDSNDPIDILSKLGGFEIGGLVGWILAASAYNVPIVIDGFISTAASLIATKFCPYVKDYLIAAHKSKEKGHNLMLKYLKLNPLLNLNMRLGEGTGAALGIFLVEAAIKIFNEVSTFEQSKVTKNKES